MLPARCLSLLCCVAWCLADGAQEIVYSGALTPSSQANSGRVLQMPATPSCGTVVTALTNFGLQLPGTNTFCTNAAGTNYTNSVNIGARVSFGPGYRPFITLISWWTDQAFDMARLYAASSTTTLANFFFCTKASNAAGCITATAVNGSVIYLTNTHSGRCTAWPCTLVHGGTLPAGPHGSPTGVPGFWGGFAGLVFSTDATTAFAGIKWQFSAQACPAGHFCTTDTVTETPCPAGTYNTLTAQTSNNSCLGCPAGSYNALMAQTSSAACLTCPTGRYTLLAARNSSADCVPCPANTYLTQTSSTFSCTACAAGWTSPAGSASSSACTAPASAFVCPANTFNSNGGSESGSCTACSPGYSSGVGSTSSASCVFCPSGQYYSNAASACASCSSGQTSPAGSTSSSACFTRPSVTYPQYSTCIPCATFSDGYWCQPTSTCYSGVSTSACSVSTIGSPSSCPALTSCSAGQYLASGSCLGCPSSTFSTGGSASSCTPCPGGQSAPAGSTSQAACIVPYACDAGQYNALISNSSSGCAACPANTSSAAGQLICSSCYPGQTAPPGSTACAQTGTGTALATSLCAVLRSSADITALALPAPGAGTLRCPIWTVQGSGTSARVVTNGTQAVPGGLCATFTGLCNRLFDESPYCVGLCTDYSGQRYFGCPPRVQRQSRIVWPTSLSAAVSRNLVSSTFLLGSIFTNTSTHLCSNATCGDCTSFSCPAGSHNPTLGQTSKSCEQCGVGRYSPAGAVVCCPLGTYQLLGSTDCVPCAAGTANSVQGSTSPADCQACAPGRSSGAGAGTCCALGSWAPPGAATCTLCPAGSFSTTPAATSAASCQLCAAGTYHPRAGASSPCGVCSPGTYAPTAGASTCTACPAGTFQPTSGASSAAACFPCNPGYYVNTSGSIECIPCPPGTASSDIQAASASVCVPCEPGSFSNLPGQQFCGKYCPKGFVGNVSGGESLAEACSACVAGSYSAFSGGTECESCAPGRYASLPNSSRCTLCPPGTASPFLGAATETTCKECAPGSYALAAGSTACISCPPGRACAASGASDPSQCAACLPGRYAPLPGSPDCALTPPGTYAAAGASAATPCALGRYGVLAGASTADQCAPCPAGLSTASEGATQVAQCLAIAITCGVGTQLAVVDASGGTSSSPQCVPLECALPLRPEAASSRSTEKDALLLNQSLACIGCGAGSSGVPPDCLPCPLGSACPGLLSLPLVNFSRQLPLAETAAALPWKDCPALAQAPAQGPLPAPSPPLSRSLIGLYSGGSLLSVLLLVAVVLGRCSDSVLRCLARFTASVDIFALSHHVPPNASPVSVTTSLGGVFTLMAYTAICTYAAFMVVQFLDNNTLEQRSLGSLTEGVWGSVASLPWAAIGEPGASGGSANLQLRVTAVGEPGACAAPAFAFSGLASGAWSLETLRDCGGASAASQLRLSCAACRLTSDTRLTLDFHYSCQALYLEASGVPPYPRSPLARTLLTAPPALTAGQAAEGGSALLGEVTWEVTPVLSVLFDNSSTALSLALGREGFSGSLGWQLTGQKVALGAALGAKRGANGSLTLAPAAARVRLTIALPLASTYALTVLSPQVQVTQLLANIVGLSGMLGLFGVLFQAYERFLAGRGKAGRVLATSGTDGGSQEQKAAGVGATEGPLQQQQQLLTHPQLPQQQENLALHNLPNAAAAQPGPGFRQAAGSSSAAAPGIPRRAQPPPFPQPAPPQDSSREAVAAGGGLIENPLQPLAHRQRQQQQQQQPQQQEDLRLQYAAAAPATASLRLTVQSGAGAREAAGGGSGGGAAAPGSPPRALPPPYPRPAPPQEPVTWARHSEGGESWYVSSKGEAAWDLPAGAAVSSMRIRAQI